MKAHNVLKTKKFENKNTVICSTNLILKIIFLLKLADDDERMVEATDLLMMKKSFFLKCCINNNVHKSLKPMTYNVTCVRCDATLGVRHDVRHDVRGGVRGGA